MIINKVNDPTNWQRLKSFWESEGKPGYVSTGNELYTVLTPNGDEEVIFNKMGTPQEMYMGASGQSDQRLPSIGKVQESTPKEEVPLKKITRGRKS